MSHIGESCIEEVGWRFVQTSLCVRWCGAVAG